MDSASNSSNHDSEAAMFKAYLTQMDTLVQGIEYLRSHGFTLDLLIDEKGLYVRGSDKRFDSRQIRIIAHRRFEGKSDPADMSVLYGLELPGGKRGTLVNAYGPYANEITSDFIQAIPKGDKLQERSGRDRSSSGGTMRNVVQHALISTGLFAALVLASGIHTLFNR